jgi:hypothetical protein
MHVRIPLRAVAGIVMAGSMLFASAPAFAQNELAEDLAAILPAEVAGMALEPRVFPLALALESLDPDDPDFAEDRAAADSLVESAGVGIEKMTIGSAQVLDLEAERTISVIALQAAGADGEALTMPFFEFIHALDPGAFSPMELSIEAGQIAGRDVYLVAASILQDGEFGELDDVVMAVGDIVLLLQGDEASILEVIEALP